MATQNRISILLDGEDVGAKDAVSELENALEDLSLEALETGGELSASAAGFEVLERSAKDTEDAIEDLDDEIDGLSVTLGGIFSGLERGKKRSFQEALGLSPEDIDSDELAAAVPRDAIQLDDDNVSVDVDALKREATSEVRQALEEVEIDDGDQLQFRKEEIGDTGRGDVPNAAFIKAEERFGTLLEEHSDEFKERYNVDVSNVESANDLVEEMATSTEDVQKNLEVAGDRSKWVTDAAEAADTTEEVSEETDNAAESVQKVTGSFEEVVEPLGEISSKLDDTNEKLDGISDSLGDITDSVDDVTDAIDNFDGGLGDTEQKMSNISRHMEEIAKNTREIDDVTLFGDQRGERPIGEPDRREEMMKRLRRSAQSLMIGERGEQPRLPGGVRGPQITGVGQEEKETRDFYVNTAQAAADFKENVAETPAPIEREHLRRAEIFEEEMRDINSMMSSAGFLGSDASKGTRMGTDMEKINQQVEGLLRFSDTLPLDPISDMSDDEKRIAGFNSRLEQTLPIAQNLPDFLTDDDPEVAGRFSEAFHDLQNLNNEIERTADTDSNIPETYVKPLSNMGETAEETREQLQGARDDFENLRDARGEFTSRRSELGTKAFSRAQASVNRSRFGEGMPAPGKASIKEESEPYRTAIREDIIEPMERMEKQAGQSWTQMEKDATSAIRKLPREVEDAKRAIKPITEGDMVETSLVPMDQTRGTSLSVPSTEPKDVDMGAAEAATSIKDLQAEQENLVGATRRARGEIDFEGQTFLGAAQNASNLAEMKQAASQSNEVLAKAAGKTQHAVESERRELVNLTANAKSTKSALEKVADSELKSSFAAQHALDNFEELDDQQQNNFVSALMYAAGNQAVESSLDDVEEEAKDAENELEDTAQDLATGALAAQFFSGELGSLSLNLGAVNVALRNMSKQIPMLITTLGTLASVIGGIASSAVAAGTAIGGIFAAGAIAQAKEFKEQTAEITELSGGFEAIRANAMDMFAEAAEPLLEAEGVINFFVGTMEALAQEVNFVARTIRNMMDIFTSFASEAGNIMSSGFRQFVEDMAFSFILLQDELLSTIDFFMHGIPAAIRFMSKITENVGSELGRFVNRFIDFAAELIQLGSSIQAGMLPVLSEVLEFGTEFVETLNEIGSENIAAVASISATILVFSKLSGTMSGIITLSSKVAAGMFDIGKSMVAANGFIGAMRVGLVGLAGGMKDALLEGTQLSKLITTLSAKFATLWSIAIANLAPRLPFLAFTMQSVKQAFIGAYTQGTILSGVMAAISTVTTALSIKLPFLAFTVQSVKTAFMAAYAEGSILAGIMAALGTISTAVSVSLNGLITSIWAYVASASISSVVSGTLAGALTAVGTAAAFAWSMITGGLFPALLAIAAIGGLVVGALGNAGKASNGLGEALSGLLNFFKGIGSFLLSVFVPIWNDMVTIFETVMMLVDAVFGIFSKSGSGVDGIMNILLAFFQTVAFVVRGIFDFFAGLAHGLADFLEIIGMKRANFDDARITESQAEKGIGDAAESASDLVPGSNNRNFNFEQNNVSQNYGDVNADPEEKEAMKRLVKEAMMEANTYRRQDDGFSG